MELEAAKRASELCQQSKEPYSNLTMVASLKQASREFSEKGEKNNGDIERIIRKVI